MRVSNSFGKTLRENSTEAELTSHKLMLKAGFIHQISSGIYTYLPMAWKSLRNIEQIIRMEIDNAGGQEIRMPVLHPRELWEKSGRADIFGSNLFSLQDRRGRHMVMAPTHEELLTNIVKANVFSYKDLPLVIYQIQTKFRDEERPRGGLIRTREFDMKDAYSFHSDEESLDVSYQAMIKAYNNIYERCGLSTIMVEADSGAIGGNDSHEFMALSNSGEDTILICNKCKYAANVDKSRFRKNTQELETLRETEETHTPGVKTIESLANYLRIPTSQTLKTICYKSRDEVVLVTIRGDLEVNEVKLTNVLGGSELRLATPAEIQEVGLTEGYISPINIPNLKIVADESVNLGSNFVAGGNRENYHLININHPRDFQSNIVTDIALAQEGFGCSKCDSNLIMKRGIEVGHVFKLGTKYSELLEANFPDESNKQHPIIMGCYGIGLGRLLAAVIEQNHDEKGMILPPQIAPYDVWLTSLNTENPQLAQASEDIYNDLKESGLKTIYDDRTESAGVKFNDADLVGIPVRVVASKRNLGKNSVEVKKRSDQNSEIIQRNEVADHIKTILKE